jgi:outer membrane protein assembly factor BamB
MAGAIAIGSGVWTLAQTGGFTGDFKHDLSWRWTPTPEERLLAQEPMPPAPAPTPAAPIGAAPAPAVEEKQLAAKAEAKPIASSPTESEPPIAWAGFRGPNRDGVATGAHIDTDWPAAPPVKLWKRPIGPGWSSLAVQGDFLYTQEQRGPDEVVACYRLSTGQPVWAHRDTERFWESNGGAGPRSTPTLGNGRVYTFGATGIVNVLDARTGSVVWSRNAAADTQTKVPGWGFSSSPLLFKDLVIVAASGRLAAYDRDSGKPRWLGPQAGGSYSSPQIYVNNGVPQVLLLAGSGIISVGPADGKVLWEHTWKGVPIVQPALLEDGTLLITTSQDAVGAGVRRIAVARDADKWRVEERWTSVGLKPYFNDFVVHKGHAYGFDGSILSCIDLNDGKRKWKGGRYGYGQMVLLPEQDLLLVLAEEGELALVKATAEQYTEVARVPGIEGKTWNHPVVVGDLLLARNGEEMAAFRLTRSGR